MVQDFHSIGIVHEDLRAPGGGFYLIDFSEGRKHICEEIKVLFVVTSLS